MENYKTIIIVYTNRKLKKAEIGKAKKYAFNSSFDLKEEDMQEKNRILKCLFLIY